MDISNSINSSNSINTPNILPSINTLTKDRDSNGKFVKGNKEGVKSKRPKGIVIYDRKPPKEWARDILYYNTSTGKEMTREEFLEEAKMLCLRYPPMYQTLVHYVKGKPIETVEQTHKHIIIK